MTTNERTELAAPGRLGDPDRGPAQDPRINAALREALLEMEIGDVAVEEPLAHPLVLEQLVAIAEAGDAATNEWYARETEAILRVPSIPVVQESVHVTAPDEHPIPIEIYRPAQDPEGPLPCIVYLHGGGMVMGEARSNFYDQWCHDLASLGAVVLQVGFRNAWTSSGLNPFPTGLDDCIAAIEWAYDNRDALGTTAVIVQGESGGGNLACAAALRLKHRASQPVLAGVYASCPFISNAYSWSDERKLAELPSLVENDGYLMGSPGMEATAALYDPRGEHANSVEAWPYQARVEDLVGLPPHVIVVHELDPLRDEGIAYLRKLSEAGVRVAGQMQLGLTHGSDFDFRQQVPDYYRMTAASVVTFASHVC